MSVEAGEFHAVVYDIVRLIPYGMVTTYGHIARLAGHPSHSRMVGQALKFVQDPGVPWQRVVSASGAISDRGDGGEGAARQAERLREEGVEVSLSQTTPPKYRVSLSPSSGYGWFPNSVDLEAGRDEEEHDEHEVDAAM